ncbi:MAG TPA: T9SS type A sorting domain-containing protein [Flavobacterium sp.]|uniref:T9SS type A sorting domain-containing protein n=1 Tax=Flavobacterium sp. TaxID=239 RepID=UPI002C9605D3|nr:T9SS type A sorting domain-containing protein [Flavobacterium sp.]HSD13827.1 T9SS type A sorting domain-containing protein [Flavobacterium sp.]
MRVLFAIYFCFCVVFPVCGQAPVISYATPSTFSVNQSIVSLISNNSGGIIPDEPIVTTFAGSGIIGATDAVGTAASFNYPTVVTADHLGNIIVVDRSNHKIRKISPDGTVTTIAGTGAIGALDGIGTSATFRYPDGAVVNSQGDIFISDQSNHTIRKIQTDGAVSTFAGSGVAGLLDGTGTAARFYYPAGMAIDGNDNIYVADYSNHSIRKITPGGVVTTYAGLGLAGITDGTIDVAKFNGPTGVGTDASGNVFVADYGNHKIRKISVSGEVTTVAGAGSAGNANGSGASASFYHPAIVAVDSQNNLFVTDEGNNKIRKISPAGDVTTFAGTGVAGANDAVASSATFRGPTGVCVDNQGTVYVADYLNHLIRKINTFGYSISPDLPNGLNLNPVTGVISGTPTVTSPISDYTITATNSFGSSSFVVSIEVGTLSAEDFGLDTINIYPNPVVDNLYVSSKEFITSISVFDLLGQKIKIFGKEDVFRPLDFKSFPKGVYLLKIETASGIKEVRIVKK